ncbi:hypothetical protein NQZ68_031324 [Dissostichus eleginoides]|nr:hypothetical protein NQZ68_031324 [Dissostichus eleginoides]
MAGEVDIFTFLKSRNIPDNIVNQLKDDKIDINVINVMTDEELGKYIERYGDRLALRAFCRQRTWTNETTVKSGERTTVKSSLMEKIRDRLQEKGEKADPDVGPGVGNKHASKDTRRVEIGWLNFEKGKYYQVRTRHGGGTRHMSVQKTMTMEELLDIGKALFFPNRKSAKGPLKDFKFDVRDFSHCPVPLENTVQQLYDQTKLRMLRIYTCSKEKDKEVSPKDATIMLSDSDTSSDFEPTDHRPIKTSRKQRESVSNQPRRYHPSRIGTDHPVHHIERSSDSDPAPNDSVQEKNEETRESSRPPRLAPPEMITTEVMSSPSLDDAGSNHCQSRSRHASQEDCLFPASNQDADELFAGESDSALALAIHASMEDFEVQVGPISGYYGDDQDDTLPLNPHHLNSLQHSTLIDDAASPRGSEKEVHYVKFRRCEGEDERVPRLRPDYSEKEWQAVVTERESVEKVLEGNLEEIDEEDLLDLFSRMGSHCLPSKDKIRAAIVVMAHKALLQEPKFIIDCFHSSIHNAVPRLLTKESIMELYENKRPTNRKVAQMIKPSNESLNPQEQAALTYLLRYVRSLDQRKLEIFLRFCTGSSVLCKDSIEVTFNRLCGLSRRPVAHTCGAVLELPCTYSSYPDFRAELDSVLSGDCFTMDIL